MAKKENMELDNVESILYVMIKRSGRNQSYGGYNSDILLNKLSPLEENFLKCNICKGLMRDACSANSGQKIICKSCLTEEEVGHSLSPSNLTIEQLSCRCPLSKRGCEWQGVIAGVYKHLDTCQNVTVECSYVKFGCKHILMRSESDRHRGDSKEYHSEIVSVFMGTRVEQLEAENKLQRETIAKLTTKVEILAKTIGELENAEKKKEVLSWKVELNQIKDLLSDQVIQYPAESISSQSGLSPYHYTQIMQPNLPFQGQQNAITPGINGKAYYSPCFIIDPLYYAQSKLTFNPHEQSVVLNIQALHAETNKGMIWPLTATIIVSIIGQDKTEHYHDAKQISIKSSGSTAQIATIQYDTLRKIASGVNVIEVKIEHIKIKLSEVSSGTETTTS